MTSSIRRHVLLWVVLAVAVPSLAQAQFVDRGPYIQQMTPTSAMICWRTETPATSRVSYGFVTSALTQNADDLTPVTFHAVKVTGLLPGTRYFYQIGTVDNVLRGPGPDFFFTTPAGPGAEQPVRVWFLGESGTDDTDQFAVRDAAKAFWGGRPPDILAHVGNMALDSGTEGQFNKALFDAYETTLYHTAIFPTIGTAEAQSINVGQSSGPYYDAFVLPTMAEMGGVSSTTETYYSYDYGNVHFVVLDTTTSDLMTGSQMLTWLQSDLAANSQQWTIAYFHHPAYSDGTVDSDNDATATTIRNNVLSILEGAGVDLVVGGRSRAYERSFLVNGAYDTPTTAAGHVLDNGDGKLFGDGPYLKTGSQGTVYVVSGHGGAFVDLDGDHTLDAFAEGQYGSVIVDIDRNRLTLSNIRSDQVKSDFFTMVKDVGPKALLLGTPNGGERVAGGGILNVQWQTIGTVNKVNLDFSVDGGKNWIPFANNIDNADMLGFTAPVVNTDRLVLRISDSTDPTVFDISDAFISVSTTVTNEVVPLVSNWRFRDDDMDLSPFNWKDLAFNDATWGQGPAQLGFGDNDELTNLAQGTPTTPTYYFRKRFTVNGKATLAQISVIHDDGFVVFINGTEVQSKFVSNQGHNSYASQASSDDEVTTFNVPVAADGSPFVDGENLIAVMVKTSGVADDDLSFDASVSVTSQIVGPVIEEIPYARLTEGETYTYTVQASHPAGLPVTLSAFNLPPNAMFDPATGVVSWATVPPASGFYTYFIQAQDNLSRYTVVPAQVQVLPRTGQNDGGPSSDGGVVGDGGVQGDFSPAPPPPGGCGCYAGRGEYDLGGGVILLVLLIAVGRRRPKRQVPHS